MPFMVFGIVVISIFIEHVIQSMIDLVETVQVTLGGDIFSYINKHVDF